MYSIKIIKPEIQFEESLKQIRILVIENVERTGKREVLTNILYEQ